MSDVTGGAERSTAGVDTPGTVPCRYCEQPIEQKPGRPVKQFCDSRHRVAYRDRERNRAIERLERVIDEVRGELERLAALMKGATEAVARFKSAKRKSAIRSKKRVDTESGDL